MAQFRDKADILEKYKEIEASNTSIKNTLLKLQSVQHLVNDIPQFARGEPLPPTIEVKPKWMSVESTLMQCIEPQSVYRYTHNIPKRFEGILQLVATRAQYDSIARQVEVNNSLRKELVSGLKEVAPESRKRSELTRSLFPDILFQTLHRRIPLVPYDAKSLTASWCEEQIGLKKVKPDEAEHLVEKWCESIEPWKAFQLRNRLKEVQTVFKKTSIRVHPQAVLKTIKDDSRTKYITYKVHSPLLVLTSSSEPVRYLGLENYTDEKKKHEVGRDYIPLIEGSCLYYKRVITSYR